MTQSTRKLTGTIALILLLVVQAMAVTFIYVTFLIGQSPVTLIVFFATTGLAWALPAGMIIKWMSRPDGAASP